VYVWSGLPTQNPMQTHRRTHDHIKSLYYLLFFFFPTLFCLLFRPKLSLLHPMVVVVIVVAVVVVIVAVVAV